MVGEVDIGVGVRCLSSMVLSEENHLEIKREKKKKKGSFTLYCPQVAWVAWVDWVDRVDPSRPS